MKKRYLIPVLLILSVISLFIGVKDITIMNLFDLQSDNIRIMYLTRIPRLISILTAGAGMSISGLIMQQISRNKFVSPTTAGTLDSAKLGMLASLLLFPGSSTVIKMLFSFACALISTFVFMKLLKEIKFKNVVFVPLIGLMFGGIIDSITTFFAYRYDLNQTLSAWTQGNFAMIIKGRYELLYICIPLVFVGYLYANQFTVAGMGEDFSKNLGLSYNKIVNIGLVIIALITSAVFIIIGRVPFLGLIIPNIISIYQGDNLKKNIVPTALLGTVFLLFSDILGRVLIYPYEIPISMVIGVLGSVIFLYLLLRRKGS